MYWGYRNKLLSIWCPIDDCAHVFSVGVKDHITIKVPLEVLYGAMDLYNKLMNVSDGEYLIWRLWTWNHVS
jgi:hypothetical protein